jgi:hypothetical protein
LFHYLHVFNLFFQVKLAVKSVVRNNFSVVVVENASPNGGSVITTKIVRMARTNMTVVSILLNSGAARQGNVVVVLDIVRGRKRGQQFGSANNQTLRKGAAIVPPPLSVVRASRQFWFYFPLELKLSSAVG